MESLGYKNHWKVLNAKNYGVPQNRERVFVISIRKDLNQDFEFPVGFESDLRLKDVLEEKVDEKYYIDQEKVKKLIENINGKVDLSKSVVGTCHKRNDLSYATRDLVYSTEQIGPSICATDYKDAKKILCVGNN